MAGIESLEQLMTKFNDFFVNKKYTDVVISVIENDSLLTRESVSVEKGTVVSTINTHAIILDVNSLFFEKMLTPQKDLPTNLEIQVNKGEGRLIEIMVSSFYDKRILNTLGVTDLLGLLELGMTYANEEFMKYTVKCVVAIEPDFVMCTELLNKLYSWEPIGNKLTELCANVKARCTTFLANFFSPIEEKHNILEKFLSMNYASLIYILECDEILSFSENSLFTFIISWLEYDITRQTGIIIERLLKSLRVKFLSSEFLSCTITIDHIILNKWAGFKRWIFDCLAFLGMSSAAKAITKSTFDGQVSRNHQYGIHAWYQNYDTPDKRLTAIRWLVHVTPEVMGERFGPTPHLCVYDGIKVSPTSIIVTPIDAETEKYNMNLSISCSGLLPDVRFVVGIVPADREYDVAKQYFRSTFC